MVYDDGIGRPHYVRMEPKRTARDARAELARRLREARKEKGLSLRTLSSAAKIGPSAIHAAEQGESLPTLESLMAIVNALGLEESEWKDLHARVIAERNYARTLAEVSPLDREGANFTPSHFDATKLAIEIDIPDDIRQNFEVVRLAAERGAYATIPILSRLIVEQVSRERGADGDTANVLISGLREIGVIDGDLAGLAKPINGMIHGTFSVEEAKLNASYCINFLTAFLAKVYLVNPAIRKARESRG